MHCRKSISIGLSLSLFCWLAPVNAQQVNEYNLAAMLQKGQLITTPANQTKALENSLPGAVSTKGMVWLKDMAFKQGTIDIDLRGKNVFLQSFLGIAFHGTDSSAYDLVYFRPFNFRYPDTARRRWSVQYVSEPDFSWDKLRKEHPLVYENSVTPIPEPDQWFHATIDVKDGWVTVYVNHSDKPSLRVHLLNNKNAGGLALWDDELSGDFAGLTITR